MNCSATRNLLLGCERLNPPPGEARPHLAACADCQRYWQRLVRLEERIRQLPAPPSAHKEALLRRFQQATPRRANGHGPHPFPTAPSPALPSARRPRLRERGQQKVAVAFALAATLAAFAVGLWFWPQNAPTPSAHPEFLGPLAQRRADRDRRVAGAVAPLDQVRQLALLAEELQAEVRKNRADRAHLDELALFYREVVCQDLPNYARKLSPTERGKILPAVTDRLRRWESEASRLAAELPLSADPLREIARAAREGERRLHELA